MPFDVAPKPRISKVRNVLKQYRYRAVRSARTRCAFSFTRGLHYSRGSGRCGFLSLYYRKEPNGSSDAWDQDRLVNGLQRSIR